MQGVFENDCPVYHAAGESESYCLCDPFAWTYCSDAG